MPASPSKNLLNVYVSNLMRLPQHRRWVREEIAITVKLEK
jgi:hypothetical protein